MSQIVFTLKLTSDGELASGFGTKLVDSLLPRDINNNVIITATHLKGLIRENLEKYAGKFISPLVLINLFGEEGATTGALFHIDNAIAEESKVIQITRTKLNEYGTAEDESLRTTEAVAMGTSFTGTLTPNPNISDEYLAVLKLGLLSLFSVGGNRSRGAGSCVVTLDGEKRTPGERLKFLSEVPNWNSIALTAKADKKVDKESSNKVVTLKLIFKASNSTCVPEAPIVGNNVIKSGFTIPASAVQGAILHRLNDISEDLATACYESENFRAWPLNPVCDEKSLSLRVSFTHKVSKLKNTEGSYTFRDETIESYDWDKIPANSPLKASDGVLLSTDDGVKLWKSSDMPRVVSAHGVINGDRGKGQKRNLYTIESLAPMTYVGLLSIPESAAKHLKASLKIDSFVTLGKSRSVRGGGQLEIENVEFKSMPIIKNNNNVFIVQSPIMVPHAEAKKQISEIIQGLVSKAGFGNVKESSGSISTQFGWNRTVGNGRLGAVSVIAPGAVFKLDAPVENLTSKLVSGIGDGRERGFGAVLPHPGIAKTIYPDPPKLRTVKRVENYSLQGYELWKKAKDSNLSTSQISRVREIAAIDGNKAIEYLQKQILDRPTQIWERWKNVVLEVEAGINDNSIYYQKVLKVCQDLLAADEKGGN